MLEFNLPIQYEDLTELDVQAHIRHCALNLAESERMELLFCGTETIVPISRRSFKKNSDQLCVLLRSGHVGREQLMELKSIFQERGHQLRLRRSAKLKLLSNVTVLLPIDDPMLPVKATKLLKSVAEQVVNPKPLTFVAGYYKIRGDIARLPGRRSERSVKPHCYGPFFERVSGTGGFMLRA